ncbi:hypothetical protein M9H77_29594 [Catharanthus roseus]|uniref:Uncharacterized protein n=1 Tax=Catharanthus roseus TaxID=4058 RepID=A0ACB9ZUV3_CATRO|nr:hypothetical protein M9H77_29594 [Catharanthus roseus]
MKGILCPVLPQDSCAPLTSPLEHVVTKSRWKTNSTKRDKSYWEHVSIAHRKIRKSSGSGLASGSGSDSGSGSISRGRGRPPRVPRGRGRGCSSGRSSLSSVVNTCIPVTFPYIDTFSRFIYEFIHNWKNVVGDGIGSTTVVPLYSNSHSPSGTLFIGYLSEQLHFIQLQLWDGCPLPPLNVQWGFHRDIQLSGWEEPYYERIANCVRQQRPLVLP